MIPPAPLALAPFSRPDGAVWVPCPTPDVPAEAEDDRLLRESIERAQLATGHRILREVVVSVRNRLVILSGRVPSYYLKQLAQSAAMSAPGVRGVRNELTVPTDHEQSESSSIRSRREPT